MLKACTVVSLFIYALLTSVSYAASLLGVASITVQNSVSVHETKSLYFGTFSISNPTKSVIVNDNILTLSPRGILTVVGDAISYGNEFTSDVTTPALFKVSNSKPFIDFTLDVSAVTQLIHVDGSKNNGRLNLSRFIVLNPNTPIQENRHYTSGDIIKTDSTGTVELSVGASISIEEDKDYIDGLYAGTYSILLHY